MNKRILRRILIFFLLGHGFTLSGQTPDWVLLFQQGHPGEIGGSDYYLGLGQSSENQGKADENARVDFARNVETRVVSIMEEVYSQYQNEGERVINMAMEISTDMSLKGISVSHRYFDSETGAYYSMILILREEYNRILQKNLEEELIQQEAELERQRLALEEQRQQQEQAQLLREQELQEKEQELARERLEQEEALQRQALRDQRRLSQMKRYSEYLERQAYPRLISFDNGEVFPYRHLVSGAFGIDGSSVVRSLGYNLSFREFLQFGTRGIFNVQNELSENTLSYSDLDVKLGLLNNNGRLFKISASLGARGFIIHPLDSGTRSISGTIYGSVNAAVPQLFFTDLSLYIGLDRAAFGVAWYPAFNFLGDSLGILAEMSYVYNDDLQYSTQSDLLCVQMGLQFRPNDKICGRLTWEDNFSTFVLALDVNWKRGK